MIIDITLILSMCLYFRNIICQRHAVVMLCWNIVEELTILIQVGLTLTLVLVFGVVFYSSLVRIFMLDPNSERKKTLNITPSSWSCIDSFKVSFSFKYRSQYYDCVRVKVL